MRNLMAKLQQARALHQRGRLQEAQFIYHEILKLQPGHVEALNSLAMIAGQSREFARAVHYLDKLLDLEPSNAPAHNNRGLALQELARFELALESYNRALALNPEYAVGHYNRGNVLKELGRMADALADYDQAIAANPGFAQAHYNRGWVLQEMRLWGAALTDYGKAIALEPDYVEAHYNRGVVLQQTEDWHVALASYDRAIRLNPEHAEAHVNRGVVLKKLYQYSAALAAFNAAIAINPRLASAHFNRASALADLKQYPQSIEDYDRAIALGSDAKGIYGARRHAKMQICDWFNHAPETAALIERIERGEAAAPPFHVLITTDAAGVQARAAAAWVHAECPPNPTLGAVPHYDRHEKIRVGYFSADFHDHATLYLMAGLFEQHDRSKFDVAAFSFGPDREDAMRARLKSACSDFFEVRDKSDVDVALLARSLQIDIAVDLKGFTLFSRPGIFSRRASPLQVSYLGYPGTMGADYMDYLIADRRLVPPGYEHHYREKLIFLPASYQVNDSTRRISDSVFLRQELALPAVGFVFCCFNNNFKITPGTFDVWMRILRRVEGSVLWLYEENSIAAANLRREAERRSVDPRRLIFATFQALPDHLARHRAADLFLDTLPYNAHTTASDALWAGLPVLTCTGEAFASRVAASLLTAAGLPELITTTPAQYEELAIELSTQPQRLHAIRQRLAAERLTSPLFDTRLFTGQLEQAYTQIYERYQANLPCEHIYVSPAATSKLTGS